LRGRKHKGLHPDVKKCYHLGEKALKGWNMTKAKEAVKYLREAHMKYKQPSSFSTLQASNHQLRIFTLNN
jgi:hypothetical protein